jgi:exopolyphosphatase/pppGpp-phosphohydrolase
MSGINDYTNNLRRINDWLRASNTPHAAVFDIGTKAARVMVGPKIVPKVNVWKESMFLTAGFVTGLGGDVEPVSQRLHVDESPGLNRLADFINATMLVLRANKVSDTDIVAMGTEVFRTLSDSNLAEVIEWLKERTGLTLQVIEGKTEARLSLLAALITHTLGLEKELWIDNAKGDRLLLIDQGGGSTEISTAVSPKVARLQSKSDLGTVALRRQFFGGVDGKDPESNHASIQEQHERVLAYVQERVDSYEFPDASFKLAYGLGTAITACFPGTNAWKIHNKCVTIDSLARIERERCDSLAAAYPNVAALYQSIKRETDDNRYVKKDKEVLILYGLPVYRMILEKLGLSEMRICGFPLRYGAFLAWNYLGADLDLKPRPQAAPR